MRGAVAAAPSLRRGRRREAGGGPARELLTPPAAAARLPARSPRPAPPQVDCEVVLHRGAAAYAQVSDNWATVAPWYVDTGFTVPSALPEADHAALRAHAVAALRALGFSDGVFHVRPRRGARRRGAPARRVPANAPPSAASRRLPPPSAFRLSG